MEFYLEEVIRNKKMKRNANGKVALSKMHTETVDQLVSKQWTAVFLRHCEVDLRTAAILHPLIAEPYVRTELQLSLTWCTAVSKRQEYDSPERKRP